MFCASATVLRCFSGAKNRLVTRSLALFDVGNETAVILASSGFRNTLKNKMFEVGGEGRNRPDFPAVAVQICLILLGIQALPVLSAHIIFNRFGVRFGVGLTYAN